MLSRFAYVKYDNASGDAQNQLRDIFAKLEKAVNENDPNLEAMFEALTLPDNEYLHLTKKALTIAMHNSTPLIEKLQQLEVLYFLLGKEIRLRCIEKLGL